MAQAVARRPQRRPPPSRDFDCGLVTLLGLGLLVLVAGAGAAYRQARAMLSRVPLASSSRRAPRLRDAQLAAESTAGCRAELARRALGDAGPVIITGLEDSGTRGEKGRVFRRVPLSTRARGGSPDERPRALASSARQRRRPRLSPSPQYPSHSLR